MHKLLQRFTLPPKDTFFTRRQIHLLRDMAAEIYPEQTVWKPLVYPGSKTLPVHLLAMPAPFPGELQAPLEILRREMWDDGVMHGYTETKFQHDHRQGHLWLVTLGIGRFVPIGQSIFLAEKRRADDVFGGGFVSKWWLLNTWIKPAYRNQKIFRASIEYFQAWHPHFTMRDATPSLRFALKEHPEHLKDDSKPLKWI